MVLFPAAKNNILAHITESSSNDYDNENYNYCDDNCDNFDDYGDEICQKPDKYHGFSVKIYSFKALLLFGERRTD